MGKRLIKGREYKLLRSNPHEGFYPDTPVYGKYIEKRELTYNHNLYGTPVKALFPVFKAGNRLISTVTHYVEES